MLLKSVLRRSENCTIQLERAFLNFSRITRALRKYEIVSALRDASVSPVPCNANRKVSSTRERSRWLGRKTSRETCRIKSSHNQIGSENATCLRRIASEFLYNDYVIPARENRSVSLKACLKVAATLSFCCFFFFFQLLLDKEERRRVKSTQSR